MKLCNSCNTSKPNDAFSWRNKAQGKLQSKCKDCQKEYGRSHYKRNPEPYKKRQKTRVPIVKIATRQYIWTYLENHCCVDCGEDDPMVLDFDHLRDKEFNIAHAARNGMSLQRLSAEIEKCEVRCSNCHRRRTAKVRGWYSRIQKGLDLTVVTSRLACPGDGNWHTSITQNDRHS